MTHFTLFHVLSAGSLILLSLLLLVNLPKRNREANLYLGMFSFFTGCAYLEIVIERTNLVATVGYLIPWLEMGRWAILPSFYLAVLQYINPSQHRPIVLLHYIPTLLLCIQLFYPQSLPMPVVWIIRIFLYIQLLVYGVLSYIVLVKHRKVVKGFSSEVTSIDLRWIFNLLVAVCVLGILMFLANRFYVLKPAVDILYFPTIVYFAYYALSQQAIYPVRDEHVPVLKEAVNMQFGKEKQRLTDEQLTLFTERLLQFMEERRPYLDPLINLSTLAGGIGLSSHEISYVLNAGIGKNFYQFINEYRIEEAKALLKRQRHVNYDIQEIAVRAGFNSKTTFYTTFKKSTGLTPKQYLAQLK